MKCAVAAALVLVAAGEARAGFFFTFGAGYGQPGTTRDAVAAAIGSEPSSYGTTPRHEAQLFADALSGGLVLLPEIGWRFFELADLGLSFTAMGWRIPDEDRGGLGYASGFVALRYPAALNGIIDVWGRFGAGWSLVGGGRSPSGSSRGASGIALDLGLGVDYPLGDTVLLGVRARTFVPFFDTFWVRFDTPRFTYKLPASLAFFYLDLAVTLSFRVRD